MRRPRTLHDLIHRIDDDILKALWFLRSYHGNNDRDITQGYRDDIKRRIKQIRDARAR